MNCLLVRLAYLFLGKNEYFNYVDVFIMEHDKKLNEQDEELSKSLNLSL